MRNGGNGSEFTMQFPLNDDSQWLWSQSKHLERMILLMIIRNAKSFAQLLNPLHLSFA
jgi:hypothetical protein